jgi:hypothetical protein
VSGGGILAKRSGMYKSDKRKKELMRQKKQEMKRQKRLSKGDATAVETEEAVPEAAEIDSKQD